MLVNLQDYIIDSKQFKTLEWKDMLFVKYACFIDDENSDIWSHTNYFAYVLGGKKGWKTQEQQVLLSNGEAMFIRRGANTVYQYFEEPFYVLFIFITDDFIKKIIQKYPDLKKARSGGTQNLTALYPIEIDKAFTAYFQSLHAFFEQDQAPNKHVIRLKMEEFVLYLLSQDGNQALKEYFFHLASKPKIDIEEIMLANYTKALSLHQYAKLCARSLSSFRRDFKKVFGTTPSYWLKQKRLSYARFLLESSNLGVEDITYASGFKNRSHFIKSFKESFGFPPRKFRALADRKNF